MKSIIILFTLVFVASKFSQIHGQISVTITPDHSIILPEYNGNWKLMWQDDFDDPNLPEWHKEEAVVRSFPNPGYWYNPDNVAVNNGVLSLNITNIPITTGYPGPPIPPETQWIPYPPATFNYQAAEIKTKRYFGYGKYEAMLKVPRGIGLQSAFWTYGEIYNYNEIDVFEFDGQGDSHKLIGTNIHYPTSGNDLSKHFCVNGLLIPHTNADYNYCTYGSEDFATNFHKWTLIYQPDYIEWLVDVIDSEGNRSDHSIRKIWKYTTYTGTPIEAGETLYGGMSYYLTSAFPEGPMKIIFGANVGNSPSSDPDLSTEFPNSLQVQWVKYYQRENCGNINITTTLPFFSYNVLAASQFDPAYNLIVGQDISISCNVILHTDAYDGRSDVTLIAKNSITLKPGFHVKAVVNSKFHAYLDNCICSSSLKSVNPTNVAVNESGGSNSTNDSIIRIDESEIRGSELSKNANNENIQVRSETIQINRNIEIKVSPNPNNGQFEIIIQNAEPKDYSFSILNNLSMALVVNQKIVEPNTAFDIQTQTKGVYFLFITDNKTKKIYTNKIVYQ